MLLPEPSPEETEASSAWLLSMETARILRDPSDRDVRERVLENAHRMLRAYDATPGRTSVVGLHARTQDALDAGFDEGFPGIARERAVETLVERIRVVAYPPDGGVPGTDETAAAFFECVKGRLHPEPPHD